MSLGILTNPSSLQAQSALVKADRDMQTSMERLSTGYRINSAADDAAGLAIANRLESQVTGLNMAAKNATDGQASIKAIDSALNEVDGLLQRMRELAVQAANDTNSASDRIALNTEATAMANEITRISSSAQFAGSNILDGTYTGKNLQVGINSTDSISFSQETVAATSLGNFVIDAGPQTALISTTQDTATDNAHDGGSMVITAKGLNTTVTTAANASAASVASVVNAVTGTTGVTATAITEAKIDFSGSGTIGFTIDGGNGQGAQTLSSVVVDVSSLQGFVDAINGIANTTGVTAAVDAGGTFATITSAAGNDITIARSDTVDINMEVTSLNSAGTGTKVDVDPRSIGGVDQPDNTIRVTGRVKFSSTEAFSVDDPSNADTEAYTGAAAVVSASITNNTVGDVNLTSRANATTALGILDGALEKVAKMRGSLGALENRLDHVINHLMDSSAATSSALGKLQDTDFSVESANLAKSQVLMQAGTAMLAQANAAPQLVLQLIQ